MLEDKTRQSEEKKGLKREWCCNEEHVWEEGELGIEKDAKKIEKREANDGVGPSGL